MMKLTLAFIFATLVWVNIFANVNATDSEGISQGVKSAGGVEVLDPLLLDPMVDRRLKKDKKVKKSKLKSKKEKKAKKGKSPWPVYYFDVQACIIVPSGTPEDQISEALKEAIDTNPAPTRSVTVTLEPFQCPDQSPNICYNFFGQGETASLERFKRFFYDSIEHGFFQEVVQRNGLSDALVLHECPSTILGDSPPGTFSFSGSIAVPRDTFTDEQIIAALEKTIKRYEGVQSVTVSLGRNGLAGRPIRWYNFYAQGKSTDPVKTQTDIFKSLASGEFTELIREDGLPRAIVRVWG